MCYNENVSITTYIIGMIGSIYLYTLNYIPESIFCITVIQMQLVEYFLWKNQNCNSDEKQLHTNQTITNVGVIINHLEPIALYIGILLFDNSLASCLIGDLILFTDGANIKKSLYEYPFSK